MKNNKIVNIRAIAILVVVLGHSVIIFDPRWSIYKPLYSSNFFIFLKEFINGFQMQLFFSISGYLFFYSMIKSPKLIDIIKNKMQRLLLPFIIVGLLYMIPIRIFINYPNYVDINIFKIIFNFLILGKDSGHLWFLPALFYIFIISYIFIKKSQKNKFLSICILIFSLILNILSNYLPGFLFLNMALKWLFYFLLGYYINEYSFMLFDKKYTSLFLILALIYPLIVYFRLIDFGIFNMIVRLIFSCLTILLMYKFTSAGSIQFLSFIDKNSYGIYLFHSPILYIVMSNYSYFRPFELVGLNFFTALLFSILITLLIRKLRLKFIIGE